MNDDLISRQAAIEAIEELKNRYFDRKVILAKAQDAVNNMPTIDPVKHGRWSREHLPSTNGGTYEVWRCSECQSAFNWRMRYCGHCGARMEGEEDEQI